MATTMTRRTAMWISQNVPGDLTLLFDTNTDRDALAPFVRENERPPDDTLLVVVNIQTLYHLRQTFAQVLLRGDASANYGIIDDSHGRVMAAILIEAKCRENPDLRQIYGWTR